MFYSEYVEDGSPAAVENTLGAREQYLLSLDPDTSYHTLVKLICPLQRVSALDDCYNIVYVNNICRFHLSMQLRMMMDGVHGVTEKTTHQNMFEHKMGSNHSRK